MSSGPRPVTEPYVGARPYEEKDGPLFFGREREVRELASLLVAERIVLLHSPSGAGKTSLIHAKLVDHLIGRDFDVLPVVRVGHSRGGDPGAEAGVNRYTRSTLASLEPPREPAAGEPEEVYTDLPGLEPALRRRAARVRGGRDRDPDTVLIFDQFEEVLTADPFDLDAKEEFFWELGEALSRPGRWALFAMRDDHVAALAPYLGAIPTRLSARYRLDLLDEPAALRAICEPARLCNTTFTEAAARGLTRDLRQTRVQNPEPGGPRVVARLGPYVEPVQLQVVCQRVWTERDPNSGRITRTDVRKIGSVDKALEAYYDDHVHKAAGDDPAREWNIRDWFARALITPQGVRGLVLKTLEDDRTQGLSNALIQRLINFYLVRAEQRRGEVWFELAHDRLIDPVRNSNAAWQERNLTRHQKHVLVWEREGRPVKRLLTRKDDLDEFAKWAGSRADDLTPSERAFLDRSRRHAEEQARAEPEPPVKYESISIGPTPTPEEQGDAVELEILLSAGKGGAYTLRLRTAQPGARGPDASVDGDEWPVDLAPFFEVDDPLSEDESGLHLMRALFADGRAVTTFARAKAVALGLGVPLAVRLSVGRDATELHALPWETLIDPTTDQPLAARGVTPFARLVIPSSARPLPQPRPAGSRPTALALLASPLDREPLGDQLEGVERALADYDATLIAEPGAATLDNLISRLMNGPGGATGAGFDVLCVLARSSSRPGRGFVVELCDREGRTHFVPGERLVGQLSGLMKLPGLVVLIGNETAEPARELLNAGATTTVGMQGEVRVSTGAAFTEAFFRALVRERGGVDRAMAAARASLILAERPEWLAPVLFTRTRSARAWYELPAAKGDVREALPVTATAGPARGTRLAGEDAGWAPMIKAVRNWRYVPILGPGLVEDVLGSRKEIAARWVERFRLAVPPEDSRDFPKVAQALAVTLGFPFVRDELFKEYREAVGRRFGDLPGPERPEDRGSLDPLIRAAGEQLRQADPGHPHLAVARLPIPVFLTTNPDSWLPDALESLGKKPRIGALNWREREEAADSVFVDDPYYRPTLETPLVYYLQGRLIDPESLVLSEDDHFDYFAAVVGGREALPEPVRMRVTHGSHLLIGFSPEDWTFRSFLRLLDDPTRNPLQWRWQSHIVIDPLQLSAREGGRELIEQSVARARYQVFWGAPREFFEELAAQWSRQS
jgi:hypothetical protein